MPTDAPAMKRIGFDRVDDIGLAIAPNNQRGDAQNETTYRGNDRDAHRVDPDAGAERVVGGKIETDAMREIDDAPDTCDEHTDESTEKGAHEVLRELARAQDTAERDEQPLGQFGGIQQGRFPV